MTTATRSRTDNDTGVEDNGKLLAATQAELVRLLYRNSQALLVITSIVAVVLIVFALRDHVEARVLVAWLCVFIGVNVFRGIASYLYRSRPQLLRGPRAWARVFTLGAAASGFAWGAAAIWLFVPDEPGLALILAGLLMAIIAGAGQAYAAHPPAFYCLSVPIVLGLAISFVANGANAYYTCATAVLYQAAISVFVRNGYRTLATSIRLQLENAILIEQLSEEKRAADDARRVAEKATVAKSKFLAAASHDLRQPLQALALMSDAIEPEVKPRGKATLTRMREAIRALTELFQSLLDVSRLDAGIIDMRPRHCSLDQVLGRLAPEFRSAARLKGLDFEVCCEADAVYCDPVGLERVLRNLLSNAVRYTEQGSVIVAATPEGARVRVDVRDTGIGIPAKDWDNVFSEFHQLANPERDRTKGLGLGLSIVQKLCAMMDADVSVNSRPGEGSTFTLRLPKGDPDRVRDRRLPRPGWNFGTYTILVIDDEADILFGMERVLKRWGCRTLLADSEEAAIAELDRTGAKPDAIVADYRLRDGRTGIDSIRAIRSVIGRDVPGLLITGDTAPERLREVDRSGLRVLHKPIVPAELRTALYLEISDAVV